METADEVGGNYYDVINGDTRDWVIIGDVSGHGFSAGQIMAIVQSAVQTVLQQDTGIGPIEKRLKSLKPIVSGWGRS